MGCFEIENSLVTDTSYVLCSENYFMCEYCPRYHSLHSLILKFHSWPLMADSWYCLLFQPTIAEIEKTMFDRGNEIQRIKENMNNVEDKVFANFCEQIGVANIRQYEERELRYCLWLRYLLLHKTVCFLRSIEVQHFLVLMLIPVSSSIISYAVLSGKKYIFTLLVLKDWQSYFNFVLMVSVKKVWLFTIWTLPVCCLHSVGCSL